MRRTALLAIAVGMSATVAGLFAFCPWCAARREFQPQSLDDVRSLSETVIVSKPYQVHQCTYHIERPGGLSNFRVVNKSKSCNCFSVRVDECANDGATVVMATRLDVAERTRVLSAAFDVFDGDKFQKTLHINAEIYTVPHFAVVSPSERIISVGGVEDDRLVSVECVRATIQPENTLAEVTLEEFPDEFQLASTTRLIEHKDAVVITRIKSTFKVDAVTTLRREGSSTKTGYLKYACGTEIADRTLCWQVRAPLRCTPTTLFCERSRIKDWQGTLIVSGDEPFAIEKLGGDLDHLAVAQADRGKSRRHRLSVCFRKMPSVKSECVLTVTCGYRGEQSFDVPIKIVSFDAGSFD